MVEEELRAVDVMEIRSPCWLNSKNKDYSYHSLRAASAGGAPGEEEGEKERPGL